MGFFLYAFLALTAIRYSTLHEALGILYPLAVFFLSGIWLVVYRYRSVRDRAVPFKMRVPDAADPAFQSITIANPSLTSHLTNPDLVPPFRPQDREYITCYDPSTGFHLATVQVDNGDDIDSKITLATAAQLEWRKTTFAQRRKVITSLKKWLVDHQVECARVACRDTGKTMLDAALGEILVTCSKMDWIINHGEKALQPESRRTNLMLIYKKSKVYYEPLGVVAAIVSWNYPLHNAWSPILASIFAGNGIILKCSEQVIWSTSWFVGAIRECLRVCGYDPELVQVVCCHPPSGQQLDVERLTKSPRIKHITFIGSEGVGREIARAATEHLTPVTLELGGKDPAIILPNTDLKKWISMWMRGIYQNAGQNCIGIERLIVHHSQFEELHEMLIERVTKLRIGSVMAEASEGGGHIPIVDCGSMISNANFARLEGYIKAAEDAGAAVEVGGTAYKHPYHENGSYFSPTVVGDVDPQSDLAQQELFAPVAVILTYETVDEAISIANGTRYGLGASVFGADTDACVKVAKALECGMVAINDFAVFYINQDLPFGGTKASGYGRFGGPEGLRSLTNVKAVCVDRFPWLVQTSIPSAIDYPVRSLTTSWDFVSGLVAALYADGYRDRFNGLAQLMAASNR